MGYRAREGIFCVGIGQERGYFCVRHGAGDGVFLCGIWGGGWGIFVWGLDGEGDIFENIYTIKASLH